MTPFSYRPLADEGDIRLLHLFPGRGPIRCFLRHVSVSDELDYEALSYCWGAPTKKVKILVNDADFFVTRNLHEALIRLRDEKDIRILWIDAICIDQSNIAEKNIQVPLMRAIYGSCSRVLIWLGEQNFLTKSAFEGLEFMASEVDAGRREKFSHRDWRSIKRKERWEGPIAKARQALEAPVATAAFLSIFGRQWFKRVWIIQELLLGSNPLVICGGFQISWDKLEKADYMDKVTVDVNRYFANLRYYRLIWRDPGLNLFDHMFWGWKNSATDARDRIYAFMGLISDRSVQIPIKVDYAMDVEQAFNNFTTQYLRQTRNFWILGYCRGVRSSGSSWTLNYDYDESVDPPPEESFGSYVPFKAGGDVACAPIFKQDEKLLGLQGYEFDCVTGVSPEPDPERVMRGKPTFSKQLRLDYISSINFIRLYIHARRMCKIDDERTYEPTGESIRDALYYTLILCKTLKAPDVQPDDSGLKQLFDDFDRIVVKSAICTTKFARQALFPAYCRCIFGMSRDADGWRYEAFEAWTNVTTRRKFIVTKEGYMGLAPPKTEMGDRLLLLQGHKTPVVARQAGSRWKLVGDCYLHGVMDGEAFNQERCEVIWFE